MEYHFDFLVIGSGIAGLTFAIKAASLGEVAIVTKKDKLETSTNYAQGGIAAAFGADDSFENHIQDTLSAGNGLCKRDVVELVVRSGPERVKELVEWGVRFSRRSDNPLDFDLGREGGHTKNRIVHAEDMTGRAIEQALIRVAENHPRVHIFEDHFALDLVVEYSGMRIGRRFRKRHKKCWGAFVFNKQRNEVDLFLAHVTLLCTGGAGKVYLYTSNPDVATGDGLAMAYRVGAELANLEFVQFHPTCLYHPKAKNFLISEAVRGEGGRLIDKRGRAFMKDYHPLGDLACRDVVARAIDTEMKKSGDDCVFLDITHRSKDFLIKRFPNIYEKCLSLGINMAKEPIPVVPAAHYMCGGIKTDIHGCTSIDNLYAIGECACTGLHGANRLASNSLLEALVFSHQAYLHVSEYFNTLKDESFPLLSVGDAPYPLVSNALAQSEMIFIAHNWDVIRKVMWNYVGIVRRDKRLMLAQNHIDQIQREIYEHMPNIPLNTDAMELKNLAVVAGMIVCCAILRKESRGLHYNLDHLQKDDENWKRDTVIVLDEE